MKLQDLKEWKQADEVIANHSLSIKVAGYSVTLAPDATIAEAFEKVNDFTALTPAIADSLRVLARKIESQIPNTTIKITQIGFFDPTSSGLKLDDSHVTIVALLRRPGTRLFMLKLEHTHYKKGSGRENLLHQCGFDDADDKSHIWILATIPAKELHLAEEVAKDCGMVLTRECPYVEVTNQDGTTRVFRYPMENKVNAVALVNEPDSILYGDPKSYVDLLKIEDILIREFTS
jgi:hypothetical protein